MGGWGVKGEGEAEPTLAADMLARKGCPIPQRLTHCFLWGFASLSLSLSNSWAKHNDGIHHKNHFSVASPRLSITNYYCSVTIMTSSTFQNTFSAKTRINYWGSPSESQSEERHNLPCHCLRPNWPAECCVTNPGQHWLKSTARRVQTDIMGEDTETSSHTYIHLLTPIHIDCLGLFQKKNKIIRKKKTLINTSR